MKRTKTCCSRSLMKHEMCWIVFFYFKKLISPQQFCFSTQFFLYLLCSGMIYSNMFADKLKKYRFYSWNKKLLKYTVCHKRENIRSLATEDNKLAKRKSAEFSLLTSVTFSWILIVAKVAICFFRGNFFNILIGSNWIESK